MSMKPGTVGVTVHNGTTMALEDIQKLKQVGLCHNEWRQRAVTLYEIPECPANVISVGVSFDGKTIIIASEPREAFRQTLAAYPRTHVHK